IADGRKTVEQVRADTAARTAKTRALQSSPLRSGENADDPETSADAMRAQSAETDDAGPDLEPDHVRVRTAFLLRANAAQQDAFYAARLTTRSLRRPRRPRAPGTRWRPRYD